MPGAGENMQSFHGLCSSQELLSLTQGRLGLELIQRLAELLHLPCLLLQTLQQLRGGRFKELSRLGKNAAALFHALQTQASCGCLHTTHTGGNAAFRLNTEGSGLGSVIQMGAAAQLHGELAHLHHADGLTVLLTEHGHSTLLLGFLNRKHLGDNRIPLQNGIIDQPLDLMDLLRRDGLKMREVKAQAIRLHQRAGLVHMVAQNLL